MGEEFKFLDPFKRGVKISPLDIKGVVNGAVNNVTGYPAGSSFIATDGIDANESAQIKEGSYFNIGTKSTGAINNVSGYPIGTTLLIVDGFTAGAKIKKDNAVVIGANAYQIKTLTLTTGVVTGIELKTGLLSAVIDNDPINVIDDAIPYRVSKVSRDATNQITKINIYPKLQKAIVDNDPVVFGESVKIDLGDLSDENIKFTKTVNKAELKNQTGMTVKERRYLEAREVSATFIDATIENYCFFMDADAVIGTDGRLKIVEKDRGIVEAGKYRGEIYDLTDPDNENLKVIIPKAIFSIETVEAGTGKDQFLKFPIKLKCCPDDKNVLITYGDEVIDFA